MEWRTISGWEGVYEVSDQGLVRSLDRWVAYSNGALRFTKGVQLKGTLGVRGYPRAALSAPGCRPKHYEIHVLVALAFIGPCPPGQEVRHKDGTRNNAALYNLEYGTPADNFADAIVHGTARIHISTHQKSKERCPTDHLLRAPNLVNRDYRKCLSCARAHARIHYLRMYNREIPDFRELADQYYAKLDMVA
jgi:hypothetical protein